MYVGGGGGGGGGGGSKGEEAGRFCDTASDRKLGEGPGMRL